MGDDYTTRRVTVPEAEDILGEEFPVLDHGFVRLVDYLGGDQRIVQAARVSYGKGTRNIRDDRGLIRYLMRHEHTSPFEQVQMTFHAKMPIFVARQWVRHRTARLNEISGRYSILTDEFYLPSPENINPQSKDNKQGRSNEIYSSEETAKILAHMEEEQKDLYKNYDELVKKGVAKELARINLPLSLYTQWYWQIDLHNMFHLLKLRMDSHAQYEIRQYANAMAEVTKKVAPLAWEAFEDYQLNSIRFSRQELAILRNLLQKDIDAEDINTYKGAGFVVKNVDGTRRLNDEGLEFKLKLRDISSNE